jgi:hypothetical protein
VIKYKKGSSNKVVNLLSKPPTKVLHILYVRCVAYEWKDQYSNNTHFAPIMESIQQPTMVNYPLFLACTIQDGFLYKLNQLCVVVGPPCCLLLKETHSSS